jgi:hypothetical protein
LRGAASSQSCCSHPCPGLAAHLFDAAASEPRPRSGASNRITATGKGLTSRAKTTNTQRTITIILKQKQRGRLKTTVHITSTPNTGKSRAKETKSAKLTFTQ